MPLNLRTPGGGDQAKTPAHTFPISRNLAFMVLLAVVLLFALRHLFGSVHAEVGVK